jgi:hypothetical protein
LACVLSSLTGLQTLDLSSISISDAGAASLACVLSSIAVDIPGLLTDSEVDDYNDFDDIIEPSTDDNYSEPESPPSSPLHPPSKRRRRT